MDVTDDEIEQLEEELKSLEGKDSDFSYPKGKEKDNQFKFFRDIIKQDDTTRIGNIKREEMGEAELGVRHYQEIADYAEVEGLKTVANYLRSRSNIITATSMSRNGFWSELFMTQIKREKKDQKDGVKKSWFGKKEQGVE